MPLRPDALAIPLADDAVDAVDGVLASALLHLISDPTRVITEIRRVLKPGGKLMLTSNSPGVHAASAPQQQTGQLEDANSECVRRESEFHRRYWDLLDERGVRSTHYSWNFDQYAACAAAFGNRAHVEIPFSERAVWTMADYFLHRMGGKGYSRQQGVPDDLHDQVFAQVVAEFTEAYGPDFGAVRFVGVVGGLALEVFTK